ncbi:MAG: 50S ribosomal protein L31, partial [Coriobacteriales bacterium]|nr:50S ribosomal protein L31 [Coriobacteriales bacterium]
MKKGIHPDYVEATVHCSCGNTFKTRATKPELHIELCNECHPFYTGQQKFVDTGGRVQRFADKFGSAASTVAEREAARKAEKQAAAEAAEAAARAAREAKAAQKAAKAAKFAEKAAARQAKAEPSADGAE